MNLFYIKLPWKHFCNFEQFDGAENFSRLKLVTKNVFRQISEGYDP